MKKIFFYIFFLPSISLAISFEDIDIYGETNYYEKDSKSLTSNINLDYRFILHEPSHKKYVLYIGNKLTIDYDHFLNNTKVNTFTTIGIDF
jgi:hypothetical protein